ncbi:MAG: hypothetical protein VW270_25065 [Candidatus Poseidoniales archaeon]
MLKYEDFADTNDVIRAYDFFGSKEAYLEGIVVNKGWINDPKTGRNLFMGYTIYVYEDSTGFGRENDHAYIPFETSMDYDGRIEMIEKFVDDNDAEYNLAVEMMKECA